VRRWFVLLACLAVAAVGSGLLAGCSGAAGKAPADPRAVLKDAKKHLDATRTVRFRVTSAGLPKSGAVLIGGDGVAKRPASFSGRFRIAAGGAAMTLRVVSLNGKLYAEVPLTDRFVATDPGDLGVPDPAVLLDPAHGLSSFLTEATKIHEVGRSRSGSEVVEQVSARLPAKVVDRILFVADPSATIETNFFVVEGSRQLRKATFRGPFYGKGTATTYTVVLDRYGSPATISKPG
jgi:lipoprotein LprG